MTRRIFCEPRERHVRTALLFRKNIATSRDIGSLSLPDKAIHFKAESSSVKYCCANVYISARAPGTVANRFIFSFKAHRALLCFPLCNNTPHVSKLGALPSLFRGLFILIYTDYPVFKRRAHASRTAAWLLFHLAIFLVSRCS